MQLTTESSFVGLCSTCNNAATCTYRALRGGDALFCEMFDDYVPESSLRESAAVGAAASEEPQALPYAGLCVNCESRNTCQWARAEGGVWHCEEYR